MGLDYSRGKQKGITYEGRAGERYVVDMLAKIKLELVVADTETEEECRGSRCFGKFAELYTTHSPLGDTSCTGS